MKAREILRRAKKRKIDFTTTGFSNEGEVDAFLQSLLPKLEPAVLYNSFPSDHPTLGDLSPVPGLAFSVGVGTLGNGLAAEGLQNPWVSLAQEVCLEETVRFALSLIEEEAKEEKCELSPIQNIATPPLLQTLFVELETEKIGVSWKENQPFPIATAVFSVSWIAKKRTKRSITQ